MKVLILNRFVPPDPSPTARLAGDLAGLFRARGHEVLLPGGGVAYQAGGSGAGRLAGEMAAWVRLAGRALGGPRPDLIVSFSSPACLPVAAALAARWRRVRHVHWAMDVYPETAVALGVLPAAAAAPFAAAMRAAYARCAPVLALDADMAEVLAARGAGRVAVAAPWPPDWPAPRSPLPPEGAPAGARLWMYSGNLGRAHDGGVLLAAQQRLEAAGHPWWLVVQGGGAGWAGLKAEAGRLGLGQCLFRPYAAEEEAPARLAAAEVLVVTRRPEVRGLLWPSKLAVALAWPRRIAWMGEVDSAAARAVRGHAGSAAFAAGDAAGLADWLASLPPGVPAPIPGDALDRARRDGMAQWWRASGLEDGWTADGD